MLGEAGPPYTAPDAAAAAANVSSHVIAGRPETIEETAEMVTADGGRAYPCELTTPQRTKSSRCSSGSVASRPTRQTRDRHDGPGLLEELPEETPAEGKRFVEGWIGRTSDRVARLEADGAASSWADCGTGRTRQRRVSWRVLFDLMETLIKRLVLGQRPGEVRDDGVAVVPGFMRTEAILEGFGVTEANWHERSTIHRPLQWAGVDPRRHVSWAARYPHLPRIWRRRKKAVFTQPGRCRRKMGSTTSTAPS